MAIYIIPLGCLVIGVLLIVISTLSIEKISLSFYEEKERRKLGFSYSKYKKFKKRQ